MGDSATARRSVVIAALGSAALVALATGGACGPDSVSPSAAAEGGGGRASTSASTSSSGSPHAASSGHGGAPGASSSSGWGGWCSFLHETCPSPLICCPLEGDGGRFPGTSCVNTQNDQFAAAASTAAARTSANRRARSKRNTAT